MRVHPQRTIAELKELRALTGDEHGAQRVAWTDTWLRSREWFTTKLFGLPIEDHTDADMKRLVDVNLMGVILGCQTAIPAILRRGRSVVSKADTNGSYLDPGLHRIQPS